MTMRMFCAFTLPKMRQTEQNKKSGFDARELNYY